jgi:hypothetical protein
VGQKAMPRVNARRRRGFFSWARLGGAQRAGRQRAPRLPLSQPDAMATLMRRTLTRTKAPTFKNLRRIVPQVASSPRTQDFTHQSKLAHGFTWELSPATANHDFKQQDECIYPESFIVSNAAL